jgi:SHS family lactate transporter-like MFS transporter
LAIPIAPIWAFSASAGMLALGAFLIQISVQGAWGVVPTHLNELSPEEIRGTFPGFTYQLGNLLAAANAPLQAWIAERNGGDYGLALAIVDVAAAIAVAVLAGFGMERKGVTFGLAPGE